MAAIDKIYGTYDQWIELHLWVAMSKRPQYCQHFYSTPRYNGDDPNEYGPIMNNPIRVDMWLYFTCPFDWVKRRIEVMYGGKANIKRLKKSARI